ncbi:MAG: (Fe-S)-binding protein [Flavobacteriales bacterium]|nr:(Fe-S)-binding protein [Flavobacteriales bacterium]MCX7651029.1 (Fe-S)-binding protein [Flavobacteriales bacterium]MDW8431849.1 (Fe-S)-binding protein [Flavobacteriales bacterium]
MKYLPNILFLMCFLAGSGYFAWQMRRIIRNIRMGRPLNLNNRLPERLKIMALVALGQSKMVRRPLAGVMHVIIYLGFIIINIEVLEIVLDGLLGSHRLFAPYLGRLYDVLIGSFEILAAGVIVACLVFLIRRYGGQVQRLKPTGDLKGWPSRDAVIILATEIILMTLFLTMNAADGVLQTRGVDHYIRAGAFPVSAGLQPLFAGWSEAGLVFLERFCWWGHILGILAFLNYLPHSKHFHIILAFPNTFYSKLEPKGQLPLDENVLKEVRMMLDPQAQPDSASSDTMPSFGAKDVTDLTWKQLLDAYSCTECGRCTSECPANLTGKLLSPRKIMMSVRDRMEELGRLREKHGPHYTDNKKLLGDYITPEELWACTTCNACAEACPVNIDPVSVIVDLRRSLVMESSAAPAALNAMFSNVENNGAPWQFSPADRANWIYES